MGQHAPLLFNSNDSSLSQTALRREDRGDGKDMRIIRAVSIFATVAVLVGAGATAAQAENLEAQDAITAVNRASGSSYALSLRSESQAQASLEVTSPTGQVVSITPEAESPRIFSTSDAAATVVAEDSINKYVLTKDSTNPGAVYAVMSSASSRTTHQFDISVGGQPAVLETLPDGWVSIKDRSGELQNIISPAWALDSNGEQVATHYSVSGSTLIQTVELTGSEQFPVVADPAVACDWVFCTVEMNRAQTRLIAYYGGLASLTAGICAVLLPAAGWPAAVCAAAVAGMALWIQATAADAYDQGKCLGIRALIYSPGSTMHPAIYGPGGNCH